MNMENALDEKVDNQKYSYKLHDKENGLDLELDPSNEPFFQALELARTTDEIIFITGKAGSGKTTFLKYLTQNIQKKSAIVAFTGAAAINAGGQTIHSFFDLKSDQSPYVPNDPRLKIKPLKNSNSDEDYETIYSHLKYNSARRTLISSLELLVIDEVSMLRADILDLIDTILRAYKQKFKIPFGGVQIILIGDLFQLPPVEGDEWQILRRFYQTPYFFSARVWKESQPVIIEFDKIYRQTEIEFIDLLNRIRINQPNNSDLALLSSPEKIKPIDDTLFEENYIVLCSTNKQANDINTEQLKRINQPEFVYNGVSKGNFNIKLIDKVSEQRLVLKVGCQIMFLKNNNEVFNGKIGWIVALSEDEIKVMVKSENKENKIITVAKYTWYNKKYWFNESTNKIEQQILGEFTQFPIKLAWAITIHKSQGLTFDKVAINVNSFAPSGLVYVALSRCRTFDGIVLNAPILRKAINVDQRIVDFTLGKKNKSDLDEYIEYFE